MSRESAVGAALANARHAETRPDTPEPHSGQGWFDQTVTDGSRLISHAGGIDGFASLMGLFPAAAPVPAAARRRSGEQGQRLRAEHAAGNVDGRERRLGHDVRARHVDLAELGR